MLISLRMNGFPWVFEHSIDTTCNSTGQITFSANYGLLENGQKS
jgi:hypothetical protein